MYCKLAFYGVNLFPFHTGISNCNHDAWPEAPGGSSGWVGYNYKEIFRKSQAIGKERAVVTPAQNEEWFGGFERYLQEIGAVSILNEGSSMFNCDESGFALGGKTGTRVLAEKGTKIVHELRNTDKSQITVLAAVNVCCAREEDRDLRQVHGGCSQRFHVRCHGQWMDGFKGIFTPLWRIYSIHLSPRWVSRSLSSLLVDRHTTHQSPEVHKFCRLNGIILYRLPPHATHVLQPCDVSVFKSPKSAWYRCGAELPHWTPWVLRDPYKVPWSVLQSMGKCNGKAPDCRQRLQSCRVILIYRELCVCDPLAMIGQQYSSWIIWGSWRSEWMSAPQF